MKPLNALLLLPPLSAIVLAAESSRPRGVGPDFAKFFKSETAFTCISNPSITIKPSQINDDFCDCPDGSDEPGTAACTLISTLSPQPVTAASLNSTPALPGFYCRNKGHIPAYIPHSFVNDGICDYDTCCDGSDEWAGVGGASCVSKCKEIGQEWKKLLDMKETSLRAALQKRAELVISAHSLRVGIENSIAEMENQAQVLEKDAADLKSRFEDLERQERGRLIRTGGKGSRVATLAGLAKKRVDDLKRVLLGVISRRDALQGRVKELESILTTFKEEYNPNFNDEGVKRVVKAWEDYEAAKVGDNDEASPDEGNELDEVLVEDNQEHGIDWETWESEERDADFVEKLAGRLPISIRTWLCNQILDLRILLVERGILPGGDDEASESKIVTEAREAYQTVSDEVHVKLATLGQQKADLEKDYGRDDIFRALKGQCIEKDSGEYIYELCWLEGTKQKSKKGGGHTGMGQFVNFSSMIVDEELRPDGKGLGSGRRLTLNYENGQNCWNGPSRRTTVVLGCAENNEIWKIVESEKCVYRMDVGTPAVCGKGTAKES